MYRRGKHAGDAEVSPVRREPQGMCSHAHSARAPALMHRVCCCRACLMLRPRSMATSPDGTRASSLIWLYVPSHLPSYAYIPRRTPRIPNIFDSLRLLSPHIYRRGKHAGAEVSPVRREPRACARTPTPPVRLRSCTVCCCIICLLILLLCPTATNAPSMIRSQRHQLIGPILYLEHQPVLLIALSNCNKIAIDDSFNKANNNWPYTSWRTVTCDVY